VDKVHGAVSNTCSVTAPIEFYRMFCKSPLCFSDPTANPQNGDQLLRQVNILMTKSARDQSQKNFEIIVMAIGLRSVPEVITDTQAVKDISQYTSELTGEGFIWRFATSRKFVYGTEDDPAFHLRNELHGIILNSGVILDTKTDKKNVVVEMEKY
jgi:hypothetical protein